MRSVLFKELTKALLYKSSPSIVDVLNNKNWQSLAFYKSSPSTSVTPVLRATAVSRLFVLSITVCISFT